MGGLQYRSPEPVPEDVQKAFGARSLKAWPLLSPDQHAAVLATIKGMDSLVFGQVGANDPSGTSGDVGPVRPRSR